MQTWFHQTQTNNICDTVKDWKTNELRKIYLLSREQTISWWFLCISSSIFSLSLKWTFALGLVHRQSHHTLQFFHDFIPCKTFTHHSWAGTRCNRHTPPISVTRTATLSLTRALYSIWMCALRHSIWTVGVFQHRKEHPVYINRYVYEIYS